MVPGPPDRQRAIFDEGRKTYGRHEAVVGNDRNEALAGEGPAREGVIAPRAADPAAAVEEHHDGQACAGPATALGRIDVELEPWVLAERNAARHPARSAGRG